MFGTAAIASGQQLYKIVNKTNEPSAIAQTTAASSAAGSSGGGSSAAAPPSTPKTTAAAPTSTPATPTAPTPTPTPAAAPKPPAPAPTPTPAPAPAPTPAPTPTPPPVGNEYATEAECPGQSDVNATTTVLVCLTSHARVYNGLGTIGANGSLMASAAHKAADIQSCGFSHTACGRAFGYWITTDGYTAGCYAENIAQGQQTPIDVFTAWMNSAGHRANIMTPSYKDIGVAYLANSGSPIWVMHLGGC